MKNSISQAENHSAYVWVFASLVMYGYALLGLFALNVPGVNEIMEFIQSIQTTYIIIAAFTVILIEGLYIFGSVFPGSSFTLLLAAIAGLQSFEQFVLVIVSIFLGWSCASFLNVFYAKHLYHPDHQVEPSGNKHLLYTWFPAFRANHEVSEIARGVPARTVLQTTLAVKFAASVVVGTIAYIIPLFVDITQIDSREGFLGVLVIATFTLSVGVLKLRTEKKRF